MNRIRGFDSIRFICALWVTIGHIGVPPIFGNPQHGFLHFLDMIYRGIINGPAAVIVFFVISGFCIHYPYRNGQVPHLPSYYTRRLLRIGLPLLAALPLSHLLAIGYTTILWSLIAEIIYYLLYPLLLVLYKRFGWKRIIAAAFVAAYSVIATNPFALTYPAFGNGLNWLVGFPVWLLGCLLAQRSDALPTANSVNIWLIRGEVVAASYLVGLLRSPPLSYLPTSLRSHLPIEFIATPWTLNLFAFLVFWWMRQEIIYFSQHKPSRLLEWAGAWSYSVYLMHLIGQYAFARLVPLGGVHPVVKYLITIFVALLSAYLFFLVVERPSHLISVWVSAKFKKFSPSSSPASVAQRQT